ncbi:MAG: MBL fold metallo-hydrolase [Thermodesulfobacteriota bacterium]
MIIEKLTVGALAVSCYLVACSETRHGLIIDPGGDEDRILAAIKRLDLVIDAIVCTHAHPDHVAANAVLKEKTGARIVMHADDDAFFARPEIRTFFSGLGMPFSPPADTRVRDGDTITTGSLTFTVLHTPGHTPGSICLYGHGQLFTGDTLFVGGVGRTDFPGGSERALERSLGEKLRGLPPATIVWPGHDYGGERSTIGEELQDNPYLAGDWLP